MGPGQVGLEVEAKRVPRVGAAAYSSAASSAQSAHPGARSPPASGTDHESAASKGMLFCPPHPRPN